MNANKTEYKCLKKKGTLSSLSGSKPLKLVDQFSYLGSNISFTESDVSIYLVKAWDAIDRLSIIWKTDLSNKIKQDFFQALTVSILLYWCTTWILTKHKPKKLDRFEKILEATPHKTAAVWSPHKLFKSDEQDSEALVEKEGQIPKHCSVMDSYTHQCLLTNQDWHVSSEQTQDASKRINKEQGIIGMDCKRESRNPMLSP